MPLSPVQENELQQALRASRVIAGVVCYGTTLLYVAVFALKVLGGNWRQYLIGFSQVPWGNVFMLSLLAVSILSLGATVLLRNRLGSTGKFQTSPTLILLRVRSILICALLESIAIYGLVMGIVIGPHVATLALFFFAAPILGAPFLLPGKAEWRREFERSISKNES